jgi:hypothetical protein
MNQQTQTDSKSIPAISTHRKKSIQPKKVTPKSDFKFKMSHYCMGNGSPWLHQNRSFIAPDRSTFGPKIGLDLGSFKGDNMERLSSFDLMMGTDVEGAKEAIDICRQRFPDADLRITPFDSFPIGDESIHECGLRLDLHSGTPPHPRPKSRFMVTMRAVLSSMNQEAHEPIAFATMMSTGKERTDLYFTEQSLSMFHVIRTDLFCEFDHFKKSMVGEFTPRTSITRFSSTEAEPFARSAAVAFAIADLALTF